MGSRLYIYWRYRQKKKKKKKWRRRRRRVNFVVSIQRSRERIEWYMSSLALALVTKYVGGKMLFFRFWWTNNWNCYFQSINNSIEVPLKQKVKVHICLETIDRQFIYDVYYIFICSVWKLLFKSRPNVKNELIGQLL